MTMPELTEAGREARRRYNHALYEARAAEMKERRRAATVNWYNRLGDSPEELERVLRHLEDRKKGAIHDGKNG